MCEFSRTTHRSGRPALSLIEVVASTMIVGMMAVAALNSLGAATRSSISIGDRAVAMGLADDLMAEILQQQYQEPTGNPLFGREAGETATNRSNYDDIDDYNGWNQSPPRERDGTVIPDRANWRQQVVVSRVSASNPTQPVVNDQGAKLIVVTISYNNVVLAQQYAIRTDTGDL